MSDNQNLVGEGKKPRVRTVKASKSTAQPSGEQFYLSFYFVCEDTVNQSDLDSISGIELITKNNTYNLILPNEPSGNYQRFLKSDQTGKEKWFYYNFYTGTQKEFTDYIKEVLKSKSTVSISFSYNSVPESSYPIGQLGVMV
ncbi:MAG: hypothetical protein ACPGXZ_09520 [Saprospiraceae bacterium]